MSNKSHDCIGRLSGLLLNTLFWCSKKKNSTHCK